MIGGSEKEAVTGRIGLNYNQLIESLSFNILSLNSQDTPFSNKGSSGSKKGSLDEALRSQR